MAQLTQIWHLALISFVTGVLGAGLAAGAVVGIGTQALAAAAWPGYDPLARTISSLGTAASPWHALVNAGFVINALALAGGGIVLALAGRGPVRAGSVLIAIAGALGLLVAAVPEDANLALHSIGALNLPLAGIGLLGWHYAANHGEEMAPVLPKSDPLASIKGRLKGYTPGDTDLAWSRITYWRALLTAAVDQAPHEPITRAVVSGLKEEPALDILAGWLAACIDGPVTRAVGDLKVVLTRPTETITLSRPQTGVTASLTRTGRPEARIPLARREARDCLAEEMRRLDADEIYHRALVGLDKVVYV